MAVVARITVSPAGADDHDRLQQEVEARIETRGGPPDGLMLHVSHPHDDGFVIVEAWRDEQAFRTFEEAVLTPALEQAGLHAEAHELVAAWSIARP